MRCLEGSKSGCGSEKESEQSCWSQTAVCVGPEIYTGRDTAAGDEQILPETYQKATTSVNF